MPRFNGLEALGLTRAQGLDIPFIIVSGHITDNTAVAAMKSGAYDFIEKPVNPTRLKNILQNAG